MAKTSAQLKLAWGIKRVGELSREALTFEHADAYVPRVELEERSAQEVHYSVFAIERDAPSFGWPLMAGEAIQNLRAALDHVVYDVARRNRGKTQFPIFTDPCEFQVKGRPLIAGVPQAIRALIENAQPYKNTPDLAEFDPLAILNRFSNLDKHRTLATVATEVGFAGVSTSGGVKITWDDFPSVGQTLCDNTEIATFTARFSSEAEKVKVSPSFSYEVCIEGRPLVTTLVDIAKRVFEVITECESGKPMPLFAEYPIQQPLPGRHLDGSLIRTRRRKPVV